MIDLHPELIGEQNADTWNRVFTDWLGTDGAAYVSKTSMPIEEFVEAAKGSGTVFSIAHPLVNYVDEINPISIETTMPRVMASLRERGFAGVEAHYGGTSAGIRALMVKLTRDAGMIPTGDRTTTAPTRPTSSSASDEPATFACPTRCSRS